MSKTKLRPIKIEDAAYLWKVQTKYVCFDKPYIDYETHVDFICYLAGYKNTPLCIKFLTWECPISGNPLTSAGATDINLNKPSMARVLIEECIKNGWDGHNKKTNHRGRKGLARAGWNKLR